MQGYLKSPAKFGESQSISQSAPLTILTEDYQPTTDSDLGISPAMTYVAPVAAFGQRRNSSSSALSDDHAREFNEQDDEDLDDDDDPCTTIGERMELMGHPI
eukprot:TRINITY_DN1300_c0_g2_i1.p6 TRINITY_DN1300_c0_g2~~TRINITY_DN1300_c0_g2_i1.p6  ORF type:complete len:102 (-),score=24.44 TRINITY_DN1300_c0_g2_i1:1833-2138(-)